MQVNVGELAKMGAPLAARSISIAMIRSSSVRSSMRRGDQWTRIAPSYQLVVPMRSLRR